jgi:hypothetical protein
MSSTKVPNMIELQDSIIDLLKKEGLKDSAFLEMLNYCLELFDKQELYEQYYGYHNISHELVVTYNALLAARGEEFHTEVSKEDFKHLFAAALFHDYEPDKTKDKPHEELAANFVTSDRTLQNLFNKTGIDSHLVAAIILRTAYPWESNKKKLLPMISKHYSQSKISGDKNKQSHYDNLGWFLSVADRIGAYALGDFLDAMDLAKRNVHSLGWNPEYLVRRSVVYFEKLLDEEKVMTDKVMRSIPKPMRKTFVDNVLGFMKIREKELKVMADIVYDRLELIPKHEKNKIDNNIANRLFDIYDELPDSLQFTKKSFFESLHAPKTILVTLRLASKSGKIIGFAKGGPLENYNLGDRIKDKNKGKHNTIFLEPIALEMGYWGQGGGPNTRKLFTKIAKEKGFEYLTSLQHRDVIQKRIDRKDPVEFVQKLNPERLDYFRVKL